MKKLVLKSVQVLVVLANGKVVSRRSARARRIFAYLHKSEDSEIGEFFIKVKYSDQTYSSSTELENYGIYSTKNEAINALKAFLELTK